jgi:LysR family transcriptional regulator, transcriptional activator of the cysJI operon
VLFEQCRLFRDLGLEGSLTEAAKRNQISTSAASQQLRELEEKMGVSLVDRSQRPMRLTESGQLYFELCSDVIRLQGTFLAKLKGLKAGEVPSQRIRIAAIYSGLWEIAGIKQAFEEALPGSELLIEYLRPELVYSAVLSDEADFGIVSYPEPTRDLEAIAWRQERMVVVFGARHRMAHCKALQASDLSQQQLICFDKELPIQREIDRYLRDCGVEVARGAHFDSIAMVKEAVAVNDGFGILPEIMIRPETDTGRLVAVPLINPELYRPVGVIHKKRRSFSASDRKLLELLEISEEVPV